MAIHSINFDNNLKQKAPTILPGLLLIYQVNYALTLPLVFAITSSSMLRGAGE